MKYYVLVPNVSKNGTKWVPSIIKIFEKSFRWKIPPPLRFSSNAISQRVRLKVLSNSKSIRGSPQSQRTDDRSKVGEGEGSRERGFNDVEFGFCGAIQADLSVRKSRKVACYIRGVVAREPRLYNGAVRSEIARALRG